MRQHGYEDVKVPERYRPLWSVRGSTLRMWTLHCAKRQEPSLRPSQISSAHVTSRLPSATGARAGVRSA
jgi:hypothetical protein